MLVLPITMHILRRIFALVFVALALIGAGAAVADDADGIASAVQECTQGDLASIDLPDWPEPEDSPPLFRPVLPSTDVTPEVRVVEPGQPLVSLHHPPAAPPPRRV
jgi:hypothetical protein